MKGVIQISLVWWALVGLASSECNPPIDKCTCTSNAGVNILLECKDVTQLPSNLPITVTEVFCNSCQLGPKFNASSIPLRYENVVMLILFNSQISEISDGAFQNVPNVQHIDLHSNKLTTLPANLLQGLDKLVKLEVSDNLLTSVHENMFDGISTLKQLDLSKNDGLILSELLLKGLSLEWLSIAKMGLTTFPTNMLLEVKDSLTGLDMNHNSFKTLQTDQFKDFKYLKSLVLDSCEIESIESGAFNGLNNLESLNLGNNKLTEISTDVIKPLHDTLNELFIEGNQLTTLQEDLVEWDNIKVLQMGHNPWNCDCDLKWLKTLDIDHMQIMKNLENIT